MKDYLSLDLQTGKAIISLTSYNQNGSWINPIEIDTSNFYFNDDLTSNRNKTFDVSITGLKVSNFGFKRAKAGSENNQYETIGISDGIFDLPINFQIYDSMFGSSESTTITIPIFDGSIINNSYYAYVKLRLNIQKKKDENNNIIPFHYLINEFNFVSSKSNDTDGFYLFPFMDVHTSNEVVTQVKPSNFSYSKMKSIIDNSKKQPYNFYSNYSSNVFDDSYLLDDNSSLITNNYTKCYNNALNYFNNQIITNSVFIAAGADKNLFYKPFVQTIYTSKNEDYRTKGNMILKFGLVNKNKYFDYINILIRNELIKTNNQNEIVQIDFNNELLEKKALEFTNMNDLVKQLNQLDEIQKLQYINLINKDSAATKPSIIDATSIQFTQINQTNQIKATFNIKRSNYFILDSINHKLINQNIEISSNNLKLNTFNQDQVSINLNDTLIRELAKQYVDYEAFKQAQQSNILNLINCSNKDAIKSAIFIDNPSSLNKVSIQVELIDGYVFDNNQSIKLLYIPNINWKDQNNKFKPIQIDLNYAMFANVVKNYNSVDDFLANNQNPILTDWINMIELKDVTVDNQINQTTSEDLLSISFEPINTSQRKIKVVIVAKEWNYFVFDGSNESNDKMEFIVSNLLFKNETNEFLTGLNINVNMDYLYQLMLGFYQTNPKASLQDFVNKYHKVFVNYNNNLNSIIHISPYEPLALNMPSITTNNKGIKIEMNLNDGFYYLKTNDISNDKYITNYQTFISIEQIKQYHQETIKPNPIGQVDKINVNYNKIMIDAQSYDNINQFLYNMNDDYIIASYLNFQKTEDVAKVQDYKVVKTSANSFEFQLTLFNNYYFIDEPINTKTKIISINNLSFKGQELKLIPISINVNKQKIATITKQYNSKEELLDAYANKSSYDDFKDFISIEQKHTDAIEWIHMNNGSSISSIQINIKIKNGYYFANQSPLIANLKIEISNLLFKNNPDVSQAINGVNLDFKANDFLTTAKQYNNLEEFKQFLFENDNWLSFFNIQVNQVNSSQLKPIKRFNIFIKGEHKYQIELTLNDGFYFVDNDYMDLNKTIIVGNVYFQNEEIPPLVDIDVKFNSKRFFDLTNNQNFENWTSFLNFISDKIMNFNDSNNAILWTNTKDINVFNVIDTKIQNNGLMINLELNSGYYFDKDNKSNVAINLFYSTNDLTHQFNIGKKINDDANFNYQLTIALSVVIPLVALATIIIVWILINKRKNKKHKEELGI